MYVKLRDELHLPSATTMPLAMIFISSILLPYGTGASRETLRVILSPLFIGMGIILDQSFCVCWNVLAPWFGASYIPIRGKDGAVTTYSISIHPSNSTLPDVSELIGLSDEHEKRNNEIKNKNVFIIKSPTLNKKTLYSDCFGHTHNIQNNTYKCNKKNRGL